MTKYGFHDDMNEWEDYGSCHVYSFLVTEFNLCDPKKGDDAFKKHLLLEFLHYLDVIEYERGYDGHYYDIIIKK